MPQPARRAAGNAARPARQSATLKMTRRFSAAPARVFRAFVEPKIFAKWWGPTGFSLPSHEWNPRPGAIFRLDMHAPSGNVFVLIGQFREVDPPRRLVYTWTWQQGAAKDHETLVTLEFRPFGRGTELRLTHELFPTRAVANRHRGGWTQCFDRLAALLKGRKPA